MLTTPVFRQVRADGAEGLPRPSVPQLQPRLLSRTLRLPHAEESAASRQRVLRVSDRGSRCGWWDIIWDGSNGGERGAKVCGEAQKCVGTVTVCMWVEAKCEDTM